MIKWKIQLKKKKHIKFYLLKLVFDNVNASLQTLAFTSLVFKINVWTLLDVWCLGYGQSGLSSTLFIIKLENLKSVIRNKKSFGTLLSNISSKLFHTWQRKAISSKSCLCFWRLSTSVEYQFQSHQPVFWKESSNCQLSNFHTPCTLLALKDLNFIYEEIQTCPRWTFPPFM